MTREIALHCMKSYSELHSDLCELCPIYGQTGSDHCFEDALQYVIGMLEQEPTKNDLGVDCISREQVLSLKIHAPIAPVLYSDNSVHYEDIILVRDVEKLPSVTPQEPKTGEWIEHFDESGKWYECDQCHTDWGGAVNFCPNCGADMREVKE